MSSVEQFQDDVHGVGLSMRSFQGSDDDAGLVRFHRSRWP
jgi:hypothetical protein